MASAGHSRGRGRRCVLTSWASFSSASSLPPAPHGAAWRSHVRSQRWVGSLPLVGEQAVPAPGES